MKKLAIMFIAIGTLALIGSGFLFLEKRDFLSRALSAEGQVVELIGNSSNGYMPLVHFQAKSGEVVEVTSNFSSKPAAYDVGETVTVYYNPLYPEDAEISGFFSLWGTASILGTIGFGFVLLGTILLFVVSDKSRLLAKLKQTGIAVEAKVSGIYLNQSVTFNGQHPFQVSAVWVNPQSGEEVTFRSVNLWDDPSEELTSEYVTVFMDRHNPKRYVMDLTKESLAATKRAQLA